jgi:hypothetical protein
MSPRLLPGFLLFGVAALSAAESIGGKAPPRAARSVHLQWQAPDSEAFYLEVTVEQTTPGSYFMACGWSGGYFGIQQLRDDATVAIFSVWDPTKGDDPTAVRPEDRVELLHAGEGTRIRRFGGEGTGGQCKVDFAWKGGETHRFFVRAEAHGAAKEKTAYSGWLYDPRTKAWCHLVTFRTRNAGRLLRGLYSFVEDFRRDTRSVEDLRRARFHSGWVRPAGGEWRPLEQARFTASRAEWEARDNIDAGTDSAAFFLATGGATVRHAELGAALPKVAAAGQPPADLPAEAWASSASAVPR